MSLAVLADHLASKGRNGDSMLVHMTPEEVHGLHALALAHGGQLTINPETGLPEANFLKKMLPMIAGMALNFVAPGVGTAIGGLFGASGAVGTGLLVGGITGLATGSLQKGIMAGLGAYGGAGLGEGLIGASSAGASTAAAEAAKAASEQLVRDNAMAASVGADLVTGSAADKFVQDAASKAYSNFAAQPLMAQAKGSFGALKDAGGLSSLLRPAFAAATPIMADAMTPTTTQMPTGQRYQGTIRPYKFDPYTRQWTAQPTYPAVPVNTAPEPAPQEQQPPGGYNTGGIVALASGGAPSTLSPEQFKQHIYQGGADDVLATQRGVEYARAAGLTPQQTLDVWNQGLGTNFGMADYERVMRQFPTAQAPAPTPAPAPVITPGPSTPGTQGPSVEFGGGTVTPEYVAPQPQVTQGPAFQPTAPTMSEVVSKYEQGGGSTRMPTITDIKPGERTYTLNAVADMITGFLQQNPNAKYSEVQQFAQSNGIPEMQARAAFNEFRFSTMTGGTKNAYDYLMGRAPYPTKPFVPGGGPIMRPYAEAMGLTGSAENRFRSTMPPRGGEAGTTTTTTKTPTSVERLRTSFDQSIFGKTPTEKAAYYNSLLAQGYDDASIRAAINAPLDENWLALRAIAEQLRAGTTGTTKDEMDMMAGMRRGGLADVAAAAARGGNVQQYNLGGYSDGGRLLRGPGDGVSDSIPATIGNKQPARLADGEFVIPARIVSEIGNGSTEAGARKLYAMMDRVQRARAKTTGKGKVAKNTRAEKYLPA